MTPVGAPEGGLDPAREPEPEREPEPAELRLDPEPTGETRPIIERIGLALIAAVLAVMFGGVAVAAWFGGEGFLAAMAGVGAGMTLWVGALTLLRG